MAAKKSAKKKPAALEVAASMTTEQVGASATSPEGAEPRSRQILINIHTLLRNGLYQGANYGPIGEALAFLENMISAFPAPAPAPAPDAEAPAAAPAEATNG